MKLTVLGKYGAYPPVNGGNSAYLVQSKNTNILLDCGSGAVARAQNFIDLAKLDAIVFSHLHNDHISDLFPLSYYYSSRNLLINVYMPSAPCPQLDFILSLDGVNCIFYEDKQNIKIGDMKIRVDEMQHALTSFSISVTADNKKLFYSGDTSMCDQIYTRAEGSSLLLLDGGKSTSSRSHLSMAEVESIASFLQIPSIVTHCNTDIAYNASRYVAIAEELKTYTL